MITVTAAIIEQNHKIMIARKRNGLHLAGHWEFPGGKIEENETPEQCLQRELMEEFGIHCQVDEYVGESIFDYGSKRVRLLGYKVCHISGEFILSDHDTIRWLPIDELVDSISSLCWAPADIPLVEAIAARHYQQKTIGYYETNAIKYVESTRADEMGEIRHRFSELVDSGGHILDLGCGSGRDTKAFVEAGFTVTAMDASPAIATLTSQYLGQDVLVKKAEEIDSFNAYDGIWACASLLHLPPWMLPEVIRRLEAALLPGGVLYMSFKNKHARDGTPRFFYSPELTELKKSIGNCHGLELTASFLSYSSKKNSQQEEWLNIIATKTDSS